MLVQRARSVHWKKWAAEHTHEELKEEVWLEPALALLRKKVREVGPKSIVMWPDRFPGRRMEYRIFCERTSGRTLAGMQVYASVYGYSGKKFPHFLREGDLGSRGRALFLRYASLDSEYMFHVGLGAFR